MNVLFTWDPPRGLDRVRSCMDGIHVDVCADPAEIVKRVVEADVLCVGHFNAEILAAAKRLRWVQAFSGGVNSVMFPEFVNSPVPMTCLKGSFDVPGAEHALAVMLAFSRRLEYDIRLRPKRMFEITEPLELHGKTVGIIGLGNMGMEIARRCRAFGMRVLGISRNPRAASDDVDRVLTRQQTPQLLAESDFVIVAVPLTPGTEKLIGEKELRAMKKTAYLVDVSGRPAVYDLDALVRVLKEGAIAGANLQMIPPEGSPLWDLERLLISAHRIVSHEQYDRCVEMFCENLKRFRDGRPLLGLVDKAAGY